MSRRLSIQYKNSAVTKPATPAATGAKTKPHVKFPDELVFLESIKDNDIENVRTMLRRASLNIDINKTNMLGLTPLHQAVLDDLLDVVKLLVESGANVNNVDEDSWTPLHAACSMGYYEIAKYLLENGADANAETSDNERPIDLIEEDQDNFALISLLLNHMKKFKSSFENQKLKLSGSNKKEEEEDEENEDEEDTNNEPSSSAAQNGLSKLSITKHSLNSSSSPSSNKDQHQQTTPVEHYHNIFLNIFRSRVDNKKKIADIESALKQNTNFGNSKQFIRCLTMAVCDCTLINEKTTSDFDVDMKEFKDKASILGRFLDNNDEYKLECLHAIYDLIIKINNPPNLLKKIFLSLNESRVISKEIFDMWLSNAEYKFGRKIQLPFTFRDFNSV